MKEADRQAPIPRGIRCPLATTVTDTCYLPPSFLGLSFLVDAKEAEAPTLRATNEPSLGLKTQPLLESLFNVTTDIETCGYEDTGTPAEVSRSRGRGLSMMKQMHWQGPNRTGCSDDDLESKAAPRAACLGPRPGRPPSPTWAWHLGRAPPPPAGPSPWGAAAGCRTLTPFAPCWPWGCGG